MMAELAANALVYNFLVIHLALGKEKKLEIQLFQAQSYF